MENKNLQALTDSQNKTIESLTNRLTVVESNYGFRSSDSPDPGLYHQSLDELNNFSPAIPVNTGPGIGGVRSKLSWLQNPPFSAASFLVFQESMLNDSVPFSLKDKKIFRADRPGSSRGGLMTAVDSNIPALLVPLSLPPSEVEVLIVKIWAIPNSSSPLTVVNVYSPRGKLDTPWLESLISQLTLPFLILGDFNVHHPALGSLFSSSDAS
ncbi:hypothetical protein AVEN_138793-1 [Araneus ventricosus]|uniref:Endonuclease/exonuclease/phosphatase domain-containing protein n=1 Tax=Araneus ventricosus TaxID=182803 RepID=A0A4Y2M4T1_ARAVE|nr:hypothetical protein AVEN_138793-1 [Araneus ventricosus]